MHARSKRLSSPTYWLSVVAVGLLVGFSIQFARAWVDPVAAPPGGNVAGPVTTGSQTQTKSGTLNILGNLTTAPDAAGVGGNLLLSGSNSWVLHSPDDGRSTLYLAYYMNGAWQWNDSFWFDVNPATFGSKLSVNQVVDSKDGNFWLDPNSTSRLLDLQLSRLYRLAPGASISWGGSPATGNSIYSDGANGNMTVRTSGFFGVTNQAGSAWANMYANDYWISAAGKWASQMSVPPGTVSGTVELLHFESNGVFAGCRSAWGSAYCSGDTPVCSSGAIRRLFAATDRIYVAGGEWPGGDVQTQLFACVQ